MSVFLNGHQSFVRGQAHFSAELQQFLKERSGSIQYKFRFKVYISYIERGVQNPTIKGVALK
jgi:hypothetical protein